MNHPNETRVAEQQRVDLIREHIEKEIISLAKQDQKTKSEIIALRKTFWDDVTVNMDNAEDALETMFSIRQQSELLGERERTHGQMDKVIRVLERQGNSPYFGRIDFKDAVNGSLQSIYLGVSSLQDEEKSDFLIHDWRAPISSLYYDFSPGPAYYTSPDGVTEGEMTKKRQFIIQSGQIKSMFDTGLTIGDELLKEVLGNEANAQMKSIVATIQKEQNQLIRNESSRFLVVQGAAGSGKTSAALQRAAYLLYQHMDSLTAKNIMLFSPNQVFNSYVSKVLPELGEENIEQTTFQQYVVKRIGPAYEVEDAFTQTEKLLTLRDEPRYEQMVSSIRFKSSLNFKHVLDQFLNRLSRKGLIFKQVRFRGEIIIESSRISAFFYSLDQNISLTNRMKLTAEWLLIKLTRLEKLERTNGWVEDEVELLSADAYQEVQKQYQRESQMEEDGFDEASYERKNLAKQVVAKQFKPLKNAVKKMAFIHIDRLFKNVFRQSFEGVPSDWEDICEQTLEHLNTKTLRYEDITPYLYVKDKLSGTKADHLIQHVFVDEAQDYSPFQFEYLKMMYPQASMTILGDANQAVYAQSQHQKTMLDPSLHTGKQHLLMSLSKSYRSTKEIVEFTKELLQSDEIEAFNRSGTLPRIVEVDQKTTVYTTVIDESKRLVGNGHKSVAIITKTAKEAAEVYESIKETLAVRLLTTESYEFEKGLLVVPSYLSKGIEFDAVIIPNASAEVYKQERDRTLLYTVCTRAMHELNIISFGEMSPFLQGISTDLFQIEHEVK
ncbi:RNA polymerase recycling motor HelD [Alkalicoccobacillus porphyridii]|uniref:AAA family ATPase n=1 Tax=Alkalicoccobacillus porphyridii TaxID=2597270 RepID=A0A553ZTR4_9BACI|nr:RNA polymerase recycling motor HelD [Alkalicoccobacillus porphyridii]TSB44706.1 AAA family ATPase [Alkalicoccobacillus porphyridii]